MKPWEFSRLQPQEFMALLDGYRWRKERSEELAAYFVAQVMNLEGKSLKRPISVKKLLEPLRDAPKKAVKKTDREDLKRLFPDDVD